MTSIFTKIARIFSSDKLTVIEKFVAEIAPHVADDLTAFMKTLPDEFASLETLAAKAVAVVHDVKGLTISKSLAIAVAQSVFASSSSGIVAEAAALLKKL